MKVERKKLKSGIQIIHTFSNEELIAFKENEIVSKVMPLILGASILKEMEIIKTNNGVKK